MTELEIRNQLAEAQARFESLYNGVPLKKLADGSEVRDFTTEQFTELQSIQGELKSLNSDWNALVDLRKQSEEIDAFKKESRRATNGPKGENRASRSPFDQLVQAVGNSGEIRQALMHQKGVDVLLPEFRATMTTGAGFAPFVTRDPGVVDAISIPPTILDVIPIVPISGPSWKYMRVSTRDSATKAKAVSETQAAEEATLVYTEVTGDVRRIAVYLPFSDEQWADEADVRNLIENDLRLGVRQRLAQQVVAGNNNAPNLQGFTTLSGIYTQAKGGDDVFTAVLKGITKVRTSNGAGGRGGLYANPSAIVMHPDDWVKIVSTRDSNGRYIIGDPQSMVRPNLWNVRVFEDLNITAGTAYVLDLNYLTIRMRNDVTLTYSDSHLDNFVKDVWAVKATIRAGLQIKSAEAICSVTGL